MKTRDSKLVLWENVSALMTARYGKENLTRLAADAKIGPGTASRIKQHETSVGLDVVEALSKAFKVPPWALLDPSFRVDQPSKPSSDARDSWPLPNIRRDELAALSPDKLAKIEGYIDSMLESTKEVAAGPGNRKAA